MKFICLFCEMCKKINETLDNISANDEFQDDLINMFVKMYLNKDLTYDDAVINFIFYHFKDMRANDILKENKKNVYKKIILSKILDNIERKIEIRKKLIDVELFLLKEKSEKKEYYLLIENIINYLLNNSIKELDKNKFLSEIDVDNILLEFILFYQETIMNEDMK